MDLFHQVVGWGLDPSCMVLALCRAQILFYRDQHGNKAEHSVGFFGCLTISIGYPSMLSGTSSSFVTITHRPAHQCYGDAATKRVAGLIGIAAQCIAP